MKKRLKRNKIVIVHNGALGDFILAWPAIFSLSRHFKKKSCIWGGRQIYFPWVKALGLNKMDPVTRQGITKLYSSSKWPEELDSTLVVWFYLEKKITEVPFPLLWQVGGIRRGKYRPVHKTYLKNLQQLQVNHARTWWSAWIQRQKSTLGANYRPGRGKKILIFPGAGHRAKTWPLEKFQALAAALAEKDFQPHFVLGPAELERKMRINNWPTIQCTDLTNLEHLICKVRLVIGNDSGPLHLAGISKVPNLTLFGPTHPKQWRPLSGDIIWSKRSANNGWPCSPCTQTGRINCQKPECIQQITLETVLYKINRLLTQQDVRPLPFSPEQSDLEAGQQFP